MFNLLRLLYNETLKANEYFYRDPRVRNLPLAGAPWPMFSILAVYLMIALKWGPNFMAQRKEYNVQVPMQLYNKIQIVLNSYCVLVGQKYVFNKDYSLTCQGYNTNDTRPLIMDLRRPVYLYYMSKYLDLLDTVFFILRKKNKQISFLHVYHHSLMIFATWVYLTQAFASHFTLTGIINSFVHACMYTYYFAAALQINVTRWKRYLTQIQILQFGILTLHFGQVICNNWCGMEWHLIWVAFLQNLFILVLFLDFYYKAYICEAKKTIVKTEQLDAVEKKEKIVKNL